MLFIAYHFQAQLNCRSHIIDNIGVWHCSNLRFERCFETFAHLAVNSVQFPSFSAYIINLIAPIHAATELKNMEWNELVSP